MGLATFSCLFFQHISYLCSNSHHPSYLSWKPAPSFQPAILSRFSSHSDAQLGWFQELLGRTGRCQASESREKKGIGKLKVKLSNHLAIQNDFKYLLTAMVRPIFGLSAFFLPVAALQGVQKSWLLCEKERPALAAAFLVRFSRCGLFSDPLLLFLTNV